MGSCVPATLASLMQLRSISREWRGMWDAGCGGRKRRRKAVSFLLLLCPVEHGEVARGGEDLVEVMGSLQWKDEKKEHLLISPSGSV